jgi:hypothetical protein
MLLEHAQEKYVFFGEGSSKLCTRRASVFILEGQGTHIILDSEEKPFKMEIAVATRDKNRISLSSGRCLNFGDGVHGVALFYEKSKSAEAH